MRLPRILASTALILFSIPVLAHAQSKPKLIGHWVGAATVHGQEVPITIEISGTAAHPALALVNGPDHAPASAVTIEGNHVIATFSTYAKTIELTLGDGKEAWLEGSYGSAKVRYPIRVRNWIPGGNGAQPIPPDVAGDWQVQVVSAKGESAWTLHLQPTSPGVRGFIQRIDGDTGALYGRWTCDNHPPVCTSATAELLLSHFTDDGAALYRIQPQPDGTLLISNLLRADRKPMPDQQNLIARRPEVARAANLTAPTLPTEQTKMKNPNDRLHFSAPDLTGHVVSDNDPQFDGKVVMVTVGGSWCPNCHDEAPDLEALYKRLHDRGLEIVNLSFEEDDQLKDPARLRAFIASTGITYTVLLAGVPDQLNEKLPQADNLNCWPTSFLIDRTGHVRQIHAGYSGPATGEAHTELVKEMTKSFEALLAEPVPTREAAAK